ncbi:Bacteroides conjugative transposon TraN protein [Mucilaginibacter gossypiicola]|uniref:Bacteroides conjugative transposon TraN protein n=1 Tax=Mucilaginibacter gossypiicola TaxID=551995 RepID=A0A1H8LYX9_9SPHI|nr:DUF4138 domain-containing protein [Mucilaginibacter gossypiicola]SEO10299.1 Bacteroides conjugative transposon TraN protein [Mucilaginibacter gossypiicola]
MKTIFLWLSFLAAPALYAQEKLPLVYLPLNLTLHFISPEPIQYVDISSKGMVGDLPLKNVFRLKMRDSTVIFSDAVITIIGEKFIAQYHIVPGGAGVPTEIEIVPGDTHPLDVGGIGFSENQLRKLALGIYACRARHPVQKTAAFGIEGKVNQVFTAGDYLFLDIGYRNNTNLKYDPEDFQFKVEDKKVTKATNVQSVELAPVFRLFDIAPFSKSYRNIFVFKKLTFPGNKVLSVELNEKQLSGRVIRINLSYKDILAADTIPN